MPEWHAKKSCSSMDRHVNCPGSLHLPVLVEPEESPYAREGTMAHKLSELMLRDEPYPDPLICMDCGERLDLGVRQCPRCESVNTTVNQEMVDACESYVELVKFHYDDLDDDTVKQIKCEETLKSKYISDFGGTPDTYLIGYHKEVPIVHLFDLKYGAGVDVVAAGNMQFLSYLVLIAERVYAEKYFVTVYQPRAGAKVDTITVTPEEITEFRGVILDLDNRDEMKAGTHCRWCPHMPTCEVLQNHVAELATAELDAADGDYGALVPKWVEIMEIAPAVQKLLKEIPNYLLRAMERGCEVPGYKAVERLGNREWSVDDATLLETLDECGVPREVSTATTVKSPAQLEKAKVLQHVKHHVHRVLRGMSLVPESDKRKPVNLKSVIEELD